MSGLIVIIILTLTVRIKGLRDNDSKNSNNNSKGGKRGKKENSSKVLTIDLVSSLTELAASG
jgi:hypothetical protein